MEGYLKTSGIIEQKMLFRKKGGDVYCIGCRTSDKYIYAPCKEADVIYYILKQIEAQKGLEEITKNAKQKFNTSSIDVSEIIKKCKQSGLVELSEGEKINREIDEFELMMINLKDFSLQRLYSGFEFLSSHLTKLMVFMISVMVLAIISAFTVLVINKSMTFPWRNVFSDPVVLIYMWSIQFLSLVLHEFAHAIVGYKYGAIPKSFSIAVLYYCSLIFYIKLPGIYFQERDKRLKIWSAGIFTNLFLAACFWFCFFFANGPAKIFFAIGVLCNVMLALNNLLPFFYSDGYYILSTFLKAPNLRKRSLFQFKKLFKQGINKESVIYWSYLLITVWVTVFIFGGQILIVISSIADNLKNGVGLLRIFGDYINLFIIMGVGILGKIIGKVKGRKKGRE